MSDVSEDHFPSSDPTAEPAAPQLNHVAIPVADLARARRFYASTFGLQELDRPQLSVAGAWFALGSAQLHLTVVAATSVASDSIGHFALTVRRSELDAFVATIATNGGRIVRGPGERNELGRNVTSMICRDPDGNLFELTDAGQVGE